MLLYYFYQYEVSITESTTTSNQPSLNDIYNVPNKLPLYAERIIDNYHIAPPTNSVKYGTAVSYIQLVYILYCIIY